MGNTKKNILLIIPAYNEEETIGSVIDDLYMGGYLEKMDLLVINDGSRDKTVQVAKAHNAEVLSQIYNMGYGAALQTGYKYAVEHDYDYVFQMDADGQHDVRNITLMMKAMDVDGTRRKNGESVPDMAFGSRFLEGGQCFKMTGLKMIVIRGFRALIKSSTGVKLTDPTSGLHGLNRAAFEYYSKFRNFDIKYPDVNMILKMLLLGYKIEEFPAIMHERVAGVSMHTGVLNALKYAVTITLSCLAVGERAQEFKKEKELRLGNNEQA